MKASINPQSSTRWPLTWRCALLASTAALSLAAAPAVAQQMPVRGAPPPTPEGSPGAGPTVLTQEIPVRTAPPTTPEQTPNALAHGEHTENKPAAPQAPGNHWQVGKVEVTLTGQATLGTAIRTVEPNPLYIPPANAAALGRVGHAVGGANGDDGNLNFAAGRPTSTVAQTIVNLDVNYDGLGAFASGKAWYDYTLENQSVPWGNIISGYPSDRPLSQAGMDPRARFSGVSVQEAYAYARQDVGTVKIDARAGDIVVPFGLTTLIPGGLFYNVNAVDLASLVRPGSNFDEWKIPTPGGYLKAKLTDALTLEGFILGEGPQSVLAPCGTFNSLSDWAPQGCDKVVFGPFSDAMALTKGYFINRATAPVNHDLNFGLGGSYVIAPINTKLGFYYTHVDSPLPFGSGVTSLRSAATPFVPGNADGKNPMYFVSNPPGVESLALNFQTQIDHTTVYGEYVYHPNQPLQLGTSDILNALLSPTAPTLLRKEVTGTAPGGILWGYDRLQAGNLDVGVRQPLPPMLGAAAVLVNAEIGLKQVYDLPDPSVRRYGRADTFGIGPVNGVCAAGAPAYQCTNNGYVSPNALTYRLAASLRYDDVIVPGLQVTPTIGLTQDISGWSYDGIINQGRITANLRLHAEYNGRFFADLIWNPAVHVAQYDNGSDRQFVAAVIGVKF